MSVSAAAIMPPVQDSAVASFQPRRRHRSSTVSVTGVAGPGGGSAEKPVGLVHFGAARKGGPVKTEHQIFNGDRDAVRAAATKRALELLIDLTD